MKMVWQFVSYVMLILSVFNYSPDDFESSGEYTDIVKTKRGSERMHG